MSSWLSKRSFQYHRLANNINNRAHNQTHTIKTHIFLAVMRNIKKNDTKLEKVPFWFNTHTLQAHTQTCAHTSTHIHTHKHKHAQSYTHTQTKHRSTHKTQTHTHLWFLTFTHCLAKVQYVNVFSSAGY